MDFHGLKRKQLQGLCKKHGIPANLKNFEMADRLSSLLKDEIPKKRGRPCLNKLGVVGDAEVLSKEPNRVEFSPQNVTCVFEKTDPLQLRSMVRMERAFEKSLLEQKPVLVGGVVGNSSDTEGNCDNASLNLMVEKKEVKTLQPEASDAAFSVNEYEIANVEIDCERQERAWYSVGEVGNSEKSRNVEEDKNLYTLVANNLWKVVERFEDLASHCHLWFREKIAQAYRYMELSKRLLF